MENQAGSEPANGPKEADPVERLSPPAEAITNFQLLPDNGGYVLLLGKRRLAGPNFGQWPELRTEISSVNFISYSMMSDMARVLNSAVKDFETTWGHIPVPGVDKPIVSTNE